MSQDNQWTVFLLRTYMSCKVWHLVLQKAMLVESPPGTLVHLCCHIFSRHSHFSSLHLFEQLGASLQGQLVQRHVVVANPQQLRQLILPGVNALFGASEHDIHWHPPGAQPPGLFNSLQSLMRTVVSAQKFQVLILQRLKDWKCDMETGQLRSS